MRRFGCLLLAVLLTGCPSDGGGDGDDPLPVDATVGRTDARAPGDAAPPGVDARVMDARPPVDARPPADARQPADARPPADAGPIDAAPPASCVAICARLLECGDGICAFPVDDDQVRQICEANCADNPGYRTLPLEASCDELVAQARVVEPLIEEFCDEGGAGGQGGGAGGEGGAAPAPCDAICDRLLACIDRECEVDVDANTLRQFCQQRCGASRDYLALPVDDACRPLLQRLDDIEPQFDYEASCEAEEPPCRPACDGRRCGDDGCGGACGFCGRGETCEDGQCAGPCAPDCGGVRDRVCDVDDGCGGTCGCLQSQGCTDDNRCAPCCVGECGPSRTCAGVFCQGPCARGSVCSERVRGCARECMPNCDGRSCGDDGCGGSCGACGANSSCDGQGGCTCNDGFAPNMQGQCVAFGGPCVGVTEVGHCVGDSWVFCAGNSGVQALDCVANGLPGCVGDNQAGACDCGPVSANGTCSNDLSLHYFCNEAFGVLAVNHCPTRTGRASGLCSTFVSDFGHQTECFCDECSIYDAFGRQCRALECGGGGRCRYLQGNVHVCE